MASSCRACVRFVGSPILRSPCWCCGRFPPYNSVLSSNVHHANSQRCSNRGILQCFRRCIIHPVSRVLVLYDYAITLNDEVALFWTRGFTGASLLFFIVRYSAVFNYAILDFAIGYGLRFSGEG
ncbi:hypothetical protein C8Q79DRAFT_369344 [Trametes meyenii]|nr:hypothetical protein C8Q79DRAFT_369344 [Trametes meyenii]